MFLARSENYNHGYARLDEAGTGLGQFIYFKPVAQELIL
jgi:hypothetical protein